MKIGQKVVSDLYKEHGTGTIISMSKIFDKQFYKVFFDNTGKTIEIQKDDLKPIETSIALFNSGILSSHQLLHPFILRTKKISAF